jgi:formylglycine-generating enzyme required for sulfatase activity
MSDLAAEIRGIIERVAADRMRAEGRIKVDAEFIHGAPEGWFTPGAGETEWFKDHEHGPELAVVPAGEFLMGDYNSEKPVHKSPSLGHSWSGGSR